MTYFAYPLLVKKASDFQQVGAETKTQKLTLNLYCVLLFRPCTVQLKFSPVYFG